MTRESELYGASAFRVARAARGGCLAVACAGGIAAIATAGADWTAIPLVAGATGTLSAQLAVGILGYRRAMRAPWPQVEPAPDEDDW